MVGVGTKCFLKGIVRWQRSHARFGSIPYQTLNRFNTPKMGIYLAQGRPYSSPNAVTPGPGADHQDQNRQLPPTGSAIHELGEESKTKIELGAFIATCLQVAFFCQLFSGINPWFALQLGLDCRVSRHPSANPL